VPTLVRLAHRPGAAVRLYCLPPGGSGPEFYEPWADLLPTTVEPYTFALPGRGTAGASRHRRTRAHSPPHSPPYRRRHRLTALRPVRAPLRCPARPRNRTTPAPHRSPRTRSSLSPPHSKVSDRVRKCFRPKVLTSHRQCLDHLCLRPAVVRYFGPHRLWVIRAARQVRAQLHGRSAHHTAPAPPRFVPVRFAPAHPGSSRGWRGMRCRVAVPRLSRDGVPHACVETLPLAADSRPPTVARWPLAVG